MSKDIGNEFDPNSISVDQALQNIDSTINPLSETERVSLRDALNRIVANDVLSPINVPGYDNTAMDGYAIRGDDIPQQGYAQLKVVGKSLAGHPYKGSVSRGEAIRIMTGAPIPSGADTIVMQEHAQINGEYISINEQHKPRQHVRYAGEDIRKGGVAIARGKWLTPADLGLAASLGVSDINVFRRARVAFFSTGDELRSLGEPLGEGQIYDSNRYTIFGMLHRLDVEIIDMGIIADCRELVKNALLAAAASADVVITSGGVSVGEADYIKGLLEEIGQVNFWKIAMKPGKPLAFGRIHNAYFFGLPGNPVSSMATFYQFVKPALLKLMGRTIVAPTTVRMKCVSKLKKAPGRIDYQRGIIKRDAQGEFVVESTGAQGSHVLSSMSSANCFIVLPLEMGNVEPGSWVDVQPFEGIV
jgi:molybdopterin molybdotransferase